MQDYRKLRVWRAADDFTFHVYRVSQGFPSAERFGITGQLRRASVSIGANIAEGCGRASRLDAARFFQMALGSASEASYYLHLANRLGYIDATSYAQLDAQFVHIRRMLRRLLLRMRS